MALMPEHIGSAAMPAWRSPSFPLAVGVLLAPLAAVLQSKAMAPLAIAVLLLSVLAHWRAKGRLPWPRGAAVAVAALLGLWGIVSAAWAIEPMRALHAGVSVAGIALLAAAGGRVAAEDDPAAKARLARWLLAGLFVGLLVGLVDYATGDSIRAAVRGLKEVPPSLVFGLKPAGSVMALLLPLMAALPIAMRWRWAVLILGAIGLLLLPGDSAKIAAVLGVVLAGLVMLLGRRVAIGLGVVLGLGMLVIPLLMPPLLPHLAIDRLPFSAQHRLLIWDFVGSGIAEKPVLGWGMEAARALPGGQEPPSKASMDRLGLTDAGARAILGNPPIQRLPLHPHNGGLQMRLELGLPGVLLSASLLLLLGVALWRSAVPAAGAGVLISAFVTAMLSFGLWQFWWLASMALAAAVLGGLSEVKEIHER